MLTLRDIPPDRPVLIAGPTASGKSALALQIAQEQGGVIVNADASQVYGCWRIITARPPIEEEALAPHALYGHVDWQTTYSTGTWLRDVTPYIAPAPASNPRPIIVGGTGLYFSALTEGIADIPPIPAPIRARADSLSTAEMLRDLDPVTTARIDCQNPVRVQRAWEVQSATNRGLADWQDNTPAPLLPATQATCLVLDAPKDWLETRIRQRVTLMIKAGALAEIRAMLPHHDPALPAFRAIGVPELIDHLNGGCTLEEACERIAIATRQFAKRQRTWFRARMSNWHHMAPGDSL